MTSIEQLRESLGTFAERSMAIRANCVNEESTKQYLVLPLLNILGYDFTDPLVIQPEYAAGFREDNSDRVDYVILRSGAPLIAVECKKSGTDLDNHRGQLRGYFAALPTVQLGVLTNGTLFEFFVDSEAQNIMDPEPFVTLDLEQITRGSLSKDVLETLQIITNCHFKSELIAEMAETRLVARRLRTLLMSEVREPSEDFCRVILQRVGLRNLRRSSIELRYSGMIKAAFEEAFILPVVEHLRAKTVDRTRPVLNGSDNTQSIITTERELAIFRYVCRRLAYLVQDENSFAAIDRVQYKDYIGKFAIFYENTRKGRLFDFVEGANGFDQFVFPDPIGTLVTNTISDIDLPLKKIFEKRIHELGMSKSYNGRMIFDN
jgi:predicted type IV restriction endonuclease